MLLLAEQSESDASPETLAIYAELRKLCGIPTVPLFYRHLATIPGALEWAWAALAPVLRAGILQKSAWAITESVKFENVARLSNHTLSALGITEADLTEFHKVLAVYDRSNPVTLLGLRYLGSLLRQRHRVAVIKSSSANLDSAWQPPAMIDDLLPMVKTADVRGVTLKQMNVLTSRGEASRASPLWPSLYRHLASRPALLSLTTLVVVPAFEAIDKAAESIRLEAEGRANIFIETMEIACNAARTSQQSQQAITSAIDLFTDRLPELIAVVRLVIASIPEKAT